MSHIIKVLEPEVVSKIAAGEVVDRPASVVKELMENSIDAGAAFISVTIIEGGRQLIKVVDNGCGISRDDAPYVFQRHATSKISNDTDLASIKTFGFRGEALASILAVSKVGLKTRRKEDLVGTAIILEGGAESSIHDDGCPPGTNIEVSDLFFNTPARLKFLKSVDTEFGRIVEVFKAIALVHPQIHFKLIHGSGTVIDAPSGMMLDRIRDIFGVQFTTNVIAAFSDNIRGYVGNHRATSYPTSKSLFMYVNGRWVHDRGMMRAIIDAYGTLLERARYPFAVIDVTVPLEDVDVNIHPAKSEVRFKDQKYVYETVKDAVREALNSAIAAREDKAFVPPKKGPTATAGGSAGDINALYGDLFAKGKAETITSLESASPGSFIPRIAPAPKRDISKVSFSDLGICGQLWGEYLLCEIREYGGEFYIIDQHAAAERVAYEKLFKQYYSGDGIKVQSLLLAERFDATAEEAAVIREALDYLERLGFHVEPFGPSGRSGGETFLIKTVPDILGDRSNVELIKDLVAELGTFGGSSKVQDAVNSVLMRIACHSVIRGVRALTVEESRALLASLSTVDFAAYCPHGRPVVKMYSRAEIEAMFKRK